MLERLHIKNVAVIDEAEIQFNNGFNVLTGETGAGKSIIIDSINMVLGERTSKTLVRNGEQKAQVEALFTIEDKSTKKILEDLGIEIDEDILILYRDINLEGKGICKINGSMTTAGNLREIANLLVNIHGQQDNQSLLNPSSHIEFLDEYANLYEYIEKYQGVYFKVKEIENKIIELDIDDKEKEHQQDLLSFQINEIESANLKKSEDDELNERRKFLGSISKIAENTNYSYSSLYEDDNNGYQLISKAVNFLSQITEYDNNIQDIYDRLNSISIELEDIIYQIRDYKDSLEYNENELDDIEARLDLINGLKRKYGNTIEEIIEYKNDAEIKLNSIIKCDEEINILKNDLEKYKLLLTSYAEKLTKKRIEASKILSAKICKELEDLDMSKVKFDVSIEKCNFNKIGCDNIEFLISVNAGEPLKPLSKIASGGEMSRIMLAIKSIFADSDHINTLIFDEIDTGVSGRAAQKIAEKINKIAKKKQILCITHLAQIAAMANTHFLIEKGFKNDKTFTNVTPLDNYSRKKELARIIGGAIITDTTLLAADEMLKQAQELN